MSINLNDTKRTAIASKLADMQVLQNLLISNEQKLISACDDSKITESLQKMLDDDQKNLQILNDVIVQYGVRSEPNQTVQKMADEAQKLMEGDELSLYEKVAKHELLKHNQTMSGLLIHKAAQVVGADIEAAIVPLNTVNFENRAHQEQLKGILEVLGVRELTGEEAKQGVWQRVQDAVAAMTGVVGSAVSHTDKKMTVQDIIRADHLKVNTLFMEIEKAKDSQKIEEFFAQIYKDLSVHAEAEEQVVYPSLSSFYGESDIQELYQEQAEMKEMLKSIKAISPDSEQFKEQVKLLKEAVMDHVRQEESTMFAAIRDNCSDEQQVQLGEQFKTAKDEIQQKTLASSSH